MNLKPNLMSENHSSKITDDTDRSSRAYHIHTVQLVSVARQKESQHD